MFESMLCMACKGLLSFDCLNSVKSEVFFSIIYSSGCEALGAMLAVLPS